MAKQKKTGAKKTGVKKTGRLEFNHAMIYVRDLVPALKFYGGHLGFRLIDEYPGAYARLLAPKGGMSIALHVAPPEETVASEGVRLYFEIQDLDKFCAKLQSEGVQFTKPPNLMPWGWRHAYLNDPDGHEVSLYWAGKKRFQKTVMKRAART